MNCYDKEKLFSYVYQMLEPAGAEEVHSHLAQCARCGQVAEAYQKLGPALDDWTAPEPSPWFDAGVRARVEASGKEKSGFLGFGKLRVLAVSLLSVVLIVTGFIALRQRRGPDASASVSSRRSVPQMGQTVSRPSGAAEAQIKPLPAEEQLKMDENLSVLEDYDMLANFDVLSELPQAKNN